MLDEFKSIDWNQAVEITQDIVKVNSYKLEGKVQLLEYIKGYIENNTDVEVEIYDINTEDPYLVASKTCENPEFKLLLQGHLDVVSPEGMENPFTAEIKDGIMWGRGSADMKSGCAAILTAFIESTKLDNQKGDIYLAYSTDEEYKGDQMTSAILKGNIPKVDFCIIAEPTEENFAVYHKGNAWMKVEFPGKTAHASTPHLGINAIHRAGRFIVELEDYLESGVIEEDSRFGKPTMNIGTVKGGSEANVVPANCSIMIDKRYLPTSDVSSFIEEIDMIIEKCKIRDSEFEAITNLIGDWSALSIETETEIFKRVRNAVESTREIPVELVDMGGWGEGGYIQKLDIPTMYYGPGSLKVAHTPNEIVKTDEILSVAKGMYSIIKEMCF
jgi:acetylornithine deacetylase/succinyl-diaminopimelate desuccinylase family protein